jgi:putative tryptophan/tyrosine transport system substrate-binding protein
MPVVGFLNARGPRDDPHLTTAVLQGLKETGYVAGRDVAIEHLYADSHFDRLPALRPNAKRRSAVRCSIFGFRILDGLFYLLRRH